MFAKLVVAVAALIASLTGLPSMAAEPLTVQLRSGRTFTAPVDIRTDAEQLWLRFEGRSAQLLRPIQWSRIERAAHQGRDVPLDELQALALSIKNDDRLVDQLQTQTDAGDTRLHAEAARLILFRPVTGAVSSVDFSATLGNWDADAEDDGLLLTVAPLSRDGQLTPANLRLEVTLDANEADDHQTLGRGELRRVQRWVTQLTAAQVAAGQPVQLKFSPAQRQWGAFGRVHVRIGVDGQGVYSAEQEVRVK